MVEYAIVIVCVLMTLFGLVITVRCVVAQKRIHWLSPSSQALQHSEKISVIVPARNEEQDIEAAIRSVLSQKGVDLEVKVVNDHSKDRTGEIADQIAQSDKRVRVLHNPPLPAGWLGKSNAMQHGASGATGDHLVFTDADVLHAANCFATVLEEMKRKSYDFISLFPRCHNESLWENINIPIYFFGVAKLMAIPGLEDPDTDQALGTGALMLIKAQVFREIGGLQHIKGEMFDDVALARLLKSRNYRVGYRFAPGCVQVRLFKNNRDAFWGNTKNILTAVEGREWLAIPLGLLAFLQYWTPLLAVALGVLMPNTLLLVVGLGTYILQYFSFFTVRRILRFHPLKLLLFPLAALSGACCISRALFYHAKGEILWRGRPIRVR